MQRRPLLCVLPLLASAALVGAQEAPRVESWLVVPGLDERGRQPYNPDAVWSRHLYERGSAVPIEGEPIGGTQREASWERREASEAGGLSGGLGYAFGELLLGAEQAGVWLARLSGASRLWINGAGFVGDVYGSDPGAVPVALLEGTNEIWVSGSRGGFQLSFERPAGQQVFGRDATMPEGVRGQPLESQGAACVLNASEASSPELALRVLGAGWSARARALELPLAPLELRKVGFALESLAEVPEVGFELVLEGPHGELARRELGLGLREAREARRLTFLSELDRSVQEFSVLPPSVDSGDSPAQLVLSLHGASVQSRNQATSYSARPGVWIVAPTNRRPYGFDWQDWGRLDAYEVLEQALALTGAADERVYLTGHSMGGHGTWHLAANDPDRFAAIAPSAGWVDFDSYGGRPASALEEPWRGADRASLTLDLLDNLEQLPIFVLHGADDDNVPASHAHTMRNALAARGSEPGFHEQPGAGHWWNGERAPGADCVDWPEIFALFEASVRDEAPEAIEFTTVDPAVDSRHDWVRVLQPARYGEPARVRARWDAARRRAVVETENVRQLWVEAPGGARPSSALVDGELVLAEGGRRRIELVRGESGWSRASAAAGEKSPERSGPFKRAFQNGFVLVYGTRGDELEDRELLERARYDGQTWWYRGNGGAPLVSDVELLARGGLPGRNLILYGNADTNAAWEHVLPAERALDAGRGWMRVGDERFEDDQLAGTWVLPRGDEPSALVGVFADSGPQGSRLGYSLLTFVSGVGYPDYAVFGDEVLVLGHKGVRAAGWLDHAWRLQPD